MVVLVAQREPPPQTGCECGKWLHVSPPINVSGQPWPMSSADLVCDAIHSRSRSTEYSKRGLPESARPILTDTIGPRGAVIEYSVRSEIPPSIRAASRAGTSSRSDTPIGAG